MTKFFSKTHKNKLKLEVRVGLGLFYLKIKRVFYVRFTMIFLTILKKKKQIRYFIFLT